MHFILGKFENDPILRKQLETGAVISEENIAHDQLLDEYRRFLIVGGMPEAVSRFAESGSFLESQRVHKDIIMNFREDFGKYDSSVSPENIRLVFDYALHHACNQVRSSSAVKGLSAYQFDAALNLLKRAGLVIPVSASSCDTLPLGAGEKENNLKILPFDTGVFLSELGLNLGEILDAEVFRELNKGNLAELATGLEIMKATDPYSEAHLYYWYRSGANAEVDYVVQIGTEIIPVEVKFGKRRYEKSAEFSVISSCFLWHAGFAGKLRQV